MHDFFPLGPAKTNPVYDWVRGTLDQQGRKRWDLPSAPVLPSTPSSAEGTYSLMPPEEDKMLPYSLMIREEAI